MVELEIKRLRLSSGQHRKGFRRLLLSLMEGSEHSGPIGYVRALIAFARFTPSPEDALKSWKDILLWNKFYNPLEEEVFTCDVIYLFLCITWYKLGDTDKSKQCFLTRGASD
ncbi:hypothetical protein ACJ72_01147 [Emergomyces africanus]|uniref:Uncharacterized protein n=1 Tax=Emergomyces africanus TaxID=1955775 RepID=A0A1B7P611_9EURO|nr:hypothetical protein ACJ72_01147 [Emergomyces africanus]